MNQNPSNVRVSVIARFISKNAVDETVRSFHITSTVILNKSQNLDYYAIILQKEQRRYFHVKRIRKLK